MDMSSTIGRRPAAAAPTPCPDERGFRYRCVPDPFAAVLLQKASGDRIRPAVSSDVLAHQEYGGVGFEGFGKALPDRLANGNYWHCQIRIGWGYLVVKSGVGIFE